MRTILKKVLKKLGIFPNFMISETETKIRDPKSYEP